MRGAGGAASVFALTFALVLAGPPVLAQAPADGAPAEVPSPEVQTAQALHAAPEGLREGAAIRGFDGAGRLVTLREGSNDLVCRADDPADERFEVVCYHASLEAYIVRGRELRAAGVTGREADEARWAEAEEGRLSLPEPSIILHILTGEGYDAEEDRILDPFMRWVIYVPYATAESTGLSTEPARGSPWLMYPGTPGAHIMVTPEG
jgi:hypothetical protein